MSKLLQRLSDPAKSGVYRTSLSEDILEVLRGGNIALARIDMAGAADKDALLARIAQSLSFPEWFGGNWDALEDCLSDLSWSAAAGHVLLFEGKTALPADESGILLDILASAAASWAERKRPFFAVFVDGPPALPALYAARR